ncbi:MAG: AmmeMemoRadiSam system protein A [Deferrisomatales bacterium]
MTELSPASRRRLLEIARQSIAEGLRGRRYRPQDPEDPALLRPCGAFVTLRAKGALRGCIGSLQARGPLYRTVAEMAHAASFEDPRFPPLAPEELDRVEIEISVLSPLERVTDPAEIQVGTHGIYLVKGPCRGVLLPQVAVEYGWDRIEFLERTCEKAGLPPQAWRSGAEIYRFAAEVFGEGDLSPGCGG